MKIVESDVKLLEQGFGLGETDIFNAIEKAARVCYHSEENPRVTSENFVKALISKGHYRPLEFGTVYLTIPYESYKEDPNSSWWDELLQSPYTKYNFKNGYFFVTTNYRVLVEKNKIYSLQFRPYKPTPLHPKRITVLWDPISRAIADEFRTHVSISSLMESTRYCNYTKDKFGNELTFVASEKFLHADKYTKDEYDYMYRKLEGCYNRCITDYEMKAEEARDFLPLSIKTTMIQCAFEDDWKHFLKLRCDAAAHPDARKLANKLKDLLYERN
jgi:thymidylate synthase (FAD)